MQNKTFDRTIRTQGSGIHSERTRDQSEYRNPYRDNPYEYDGEYEDRGGVMSTIKENPLPALLIGAGLGALIIGTMSRVRNAQEGESSGWFGMGEPSTPEDTLEAWLNNAYGMELSLEQVLEHRLHDTEDQPLMHSKIQQHLEETRRHAERVRECIERRGGSVSKSKGGLGAIGGKISRFTTEFADDEIVKNALSDYAAEQFEVASYRSLVAAAEKLGDDHTARVCREILEEDERMAEWFEDQIADVTGKYLDRLEHQAGA